MSRQTDALSLKQHSIILYAGLLLPFFFGCSQTLYYPDISSDTPRQSDTHPQTDAPADQKTNGICKAAKGQLFGKDYPWNQTVDQQPLDGESGAIIDYLDGIGPWTGRFEIAGADGADQESYGMAILVADDDAPRILFDIREDAFWRPHCDVAPIPLPAGGAVQGEADYDCRHGGACHLVVLAPDACLLYEMYRSSGDNDHLTGGCMALWPLEASYTPTLRGDCCTSADAAGLPIAPLTFTADDIANKEIRHAIRFSLPNDYVRKQIFVRPATHTAEETQGSPDAPPRGARLRLKTTFENAALSPAAQIIVSALKTYGMILTDPGEVTFIAGDERFSTNTWAEVGLDSTSLSQLTWRDFEVVDGEERFYFDESCRCERDAIEE